MPGRHAARAVGLAASSGGPSLMGTSCHAGATPGPGAGGPDASPDGHACATSAMQRALGACSPTVSVSPLSELRTTARDVATSGPSAADARDADGWLLGGWPAGSSLDSSRPSSAGCRLRLRLPPLCSAPLPLVPGACVLCNAASPSAPVSCAPDPLADWCLMSAPLSTVSCAAPSELLPLLDAPSSCFDCCSAGCCWLLPTDSKLAVLLDLTAALPCGLTLPTGCSVGRLADCANLPASAVAAGFACLALLRAAAGALASPPLYGGRPASRL
jgi:hypothetical protein